MNKRIRAKITSSVGSLYSVLTENSSDELLCRARGAFRHENITPTVGDDVVITAAAQDGGDESLNVKGSVDFVIDEIAERRNILVRPAVANLTHLFIIIPSSQPEPDLLCADKLISIADHAGIEPVIIVNKADLDSGRALEIENIYKMSGFSVFLLSAVSGDCGALAEYIESSAGQTCGMTAAFAGASGVGKSTLMSALFPSLSLKTGRISEKIKRGRHTTREVRLFSVGAGENKCYLADTPGFSMLDFAKFNFIPEGELAGSFREFEKYLTTCRYKKCTHVREEGCEIIDAVRRGEIPESRHANYTEILAEIKKTPQWKRTN